MKIVRKNIEIRIYPTNVDFNDNGEKIVSINKIESNIGINRFIYNKELEFINYFKDLLIQNGYDDKVKVNDSSCNVILIMLRQEYPFLEKAESSSRHTPLTLKQNWNGKALPSLMTGQEIVSLIRIFMLISVKMV